MKFDVLTLFPEMFECLQESIIGRAMEKDLIQINLINIRDFSKDKHKKVDDTPYGGGAGMVIRPDVVYDAYQSIQDKKAKVIYLSPQGQVLNQNKVKELSTEEHLIWPKSFRRDCRRGNFNWRLCANRRRVTSNGTYRFS